MAVDTKDTILFTADHGNVAAQQELSEKLFAAPSCHALSAMAICFWSGHACWKCKRKMSVHSLVAKRGHLNCSLDVAWEYPKDDKCLVLSPKMDYQSVGTGYCVFPFAINHLDKMVANTWMRIAREIQRGGYLEDRTLSIP